MGLCFSSTLQIALFNVKRSPDYLNSINSITMMTPGVRRKSLPGTDRSEELWDILQLLLPSLFKLLFRNDVAATVIVV